MAPMTAVQEKQKTPSPLICAGHSAQGAEGRKEGQELRGEKTQQQGKGIEVHSFGRKSWPGWGAVKQMKSIKEEAHWYGHAVVAP